MPYTPPARMMESKPHAFGVDDITHSVVAPWQVLFRIVFFGWVTFKRAEVGHFCLASADARFPLWAPLLDFISGD
jgi:hypothetical protein